MDNIIESLAVALADGKLAKVTKIDPRIRRKIEKTKKTLKRNDRIKWALRHFKKALIGEVLWRIQHKPQLFQKRFGSLPAADQNSLHRQLQELDDAKLEDFKCCCPTDEPCDFWTGESSPPPCVGFEVIDEINERIGHYLQLAEKHKKHPAAKTINKLKFKKKTFGEIKLAFRHCEIELTGKKKAQPQITAVRYPANVPGEYYVNNFCIDCDLCGEIAPDNFKRKDGSNYWFVYKQPKNRDEKAQCKDAAENCPVEAIKNDG